MCPLSMGAHAVLSVVQQTQLDHSLFMAGLWLRGAEGSRESPWSSMGQSTEERQAEGGDLYLDLEVIQ